MAGAAVKKAFGPPQHALDSGYTGGMDDRRSGSGLLRRGWLLLLDGDRPWGSIDIRPDRFGVTRYRLVVYPPGISESERRRVRVARAWPMWGALVWVACEIFLNNMTTPWIALAMSTAACLGSGLVAFAMAGAPRARVRMMGAMVMAGHHDPISVAARDRLIKLADTLMDADDRLTSGHISALQHEIVWWQVYDQMSPTMHPSGKGA
ncbi:hypothetical protein C8E89_12284 [Mycolicibacterium moriokaense]|uniref:Uncharacterized protein n=2 Tax=Mycolicibacterium moriokaense TaxID=39691 RepID=A0A318H9W3_9MYCO|nr:hypothetical protein C8E89_12284 [Mycolicibacterium moriokaense]